MIKNLIIIILTIIMLFLAGLTTGIPVKRIFKTIFVDDDNTKGPWDGTIEYPYRYIQDAVENASYGDTIRVFAGVYNNPKNNIYITKTLSIIGSGSADSLIERPVSILADNVFFSGFTIIGYDYKTLKNTCCIKLKNSDNCDINNNTITLGLCCIELYDSHNNNIENNIIAYSKQDKPSIYLFSSNNNIIRKNLFDSNDIGIYLDHCQYNIIDNNNFTYEGTTAITIYSSNNNTIKGNTINKQRYSINVRSSNYNTIFDNNIIDNFDGVRLSDSRSNNFFGNNLFNNINSMYIDGSNDIISNNNISNNLRGLSLGDLSNGNIISGNNISSNKDWGILISGFYNIISSNIISHNDYGIIRQSYIGRWIYSSNFLIKGNIIANNNKSGIEIWNVSFYNITRNNISNNMYGIKLYGSKNTIISRNTISSNSNDGIFLFPYIVGGGIPFKYHYPFTKNQIIRNLISNNGNGIILWSDFKYWFKSRDNIILRNNIINNKQDAFIKNAFLNRWQLNYWNKSQLLPKLIPGEFHNSDLDPSNPSFSWFAFDWRPALKPYDI